MTMMPIHRLGSNAFTVQLCSPPHPQLSPVENEGLFDMSSVYSQPEESICKCHFKIFLVWGQALTLRLTERSVCCCVVRAGQARTQEACLSPGWRCPGRAGDLGRLPAGAESAVHTCFWGVWRTSWGRRPGRVRATTTTKTLQASRVRWHPKHSGKQSCL